MGPVGFIHQQHSPVPMGDFRDFPSIRCQSEIIGGGQEHGPDLRILFQSRLHLFWAHLESQTPLRIISRLYIHRPQPTQDQSSQHAPVAVPGHQDLLSRPHGSQQHTMDHPCGPVDSQEATICPIKPGSQFFRFPDAALGSVDVIQFGHQGYIAGKGHVPHQMAQRRIRSPASLVAGGMERIYMLKTVVFHCRQ